AVVLVRGHVQGTLSVRVGGEEAHVTQNVGDQDPPASREGQAQRAGIVRRRKVGSEGGEGEPRHNAGWGEREGGLAPIFKLLEAKPNRGFAGRPRAKATLGS